MTAGRGNNSSVLDGNISQADLEFQAELDALMLIVPYSVPVLFSIIILVGFIGNLLVVAVVVLNKNMRNNTNILIFNLAVSDLLFLVFCVPFTAADYALTSVWHFGVLWCVMNQTIIVLVAYVSIYTLVLMAVDRYLAVVFPVQSRTLRTKGNTLLAIGLSWSVSFLFSAAAIPLHGLSESRMGGTYQCNFIGSDNEFMIFQMSFFVLSYFLPLALLVCLYSVMLHSLWYKSSAAVTSQDTVNRKKRVVQLVTVVTLMFALSWLPIQLILVFKSAGLYPVTILNISVQIGSHILAYSNSCVNPILYAFLSPQFRSGFTALLWRGGAASPATLTTLATNMPKQT